MFIDALLRLQKGEHDDVIQWPFEHTFRLIILHPLEREQKVSIRKIYRHLEGYKKPTNSSNRSVRFHDCFKFVDLKTGGYVCDDKLRIRVELL